MRFFYFSLFLLIVVPKFSLADVTGCIVSGYLYDIPAGQDNSDPFNIVYFFSDSRSYLINYNYTNPAVGHVQCTVEDPYDYAGKCKIAYSGGGYSAKNDIFSAKLIPCDATNVPLDSYSNLSLVVLGIVGFISIKWKVKGLFSF